MYCGDETGAFVGDVGSHTARFGYSGEDCPKVVVPSVAYRRRRRPDASMSAAAAATSSFAPRRYYSAPISFLNPPPEDCVDDGCDDCGFVPAYSSMNSNDARHRTVVGSAEDGVIHDFEAWTALWEYSYEALCVRGKGKHIRGSSRSASTDDGGGARDGPIDHPLLAVDPGLAVGRSPPSLGDNDDGTDLSAFASERRRARIGAKQSAELLEILFERLSAPAAFLAPSAMLSSFAAGRQTALVVDVGHERSRVTPIVDGLVMGAGRTRSGRAGRWLGYVQRAAVGGDWDGYGGAAAKWNGWTKDNPSDGTKSLPPVVGRGVLPRYLCRSTGGPTAVHTNALRRLHRSPFHAAAVHEVMEEMMTSRHVSPLGSEGRSNAAGDGGGLGGAPFCGYGGVNTAGGARKRSAPSGSDSDADENMPDAAVEAFSQSLSVRTADGQAKNVEKEGEGRLAESPSYELPDGTRVDLTNSRAGRDLCRLPELFFSDKIPFFGESSPPDPDPHFLPLHQLVRESLTNVLDADARKELCGNIVLTGSASLFPDLDRRLSAELRDALPSAYKYKVIASKNDAERKYGAWIGGSILASLGSFQQLWLSRAEYEEYGAALGLQRFP